MDYYTFYKIKDEYLDLWGDELPNPNWFTYDDLKEICRGWGCDVEDVFYQLEVIHYVF